MSRARTALRREDDGVTAMEYALIVALIAIVLILALTLAGETLRDFYCLTADWLGWTAERDMTDMPELGSSGICAETG